MYPPSGFLNELGPHFSPLSAFLYRREVEKTLDSSRERVLLTAKEFTLTEISRCHCLPLLITNSPCCTRFCFPLLPFLLVIRFFHHSPITLHTFPFSEKFRCPTNSFLISWFVRTNISHLRNTIYLREDKLCRLMSFLLIISDIFREGKYKTEVYKRERKRESQFWKLHRGEKSVNWIARWTKIELFRSSVK